MRDEPLFFPNPHDPDPTETSEWQESLEAVLQYQSPERAAFLLDRLLVQAQAKGVELNYRATTPYRNTIAPQTQPRYPGDLELEARLTALMRWNALAMVARANRENPELGGHIATYASAAELYEVAFNHFFQAPSPNHRGDLVFFQPHAAPGIYARAFLEGRLSEDQLLHYRREVGGKGLSSYPHPYLMPEFWQFPTASMGLGPVMAIYQARFMKYLENRGLTQFAGRKVWCFVGDGEMDETQARGALSVASREGLDNLIFVVNCNLQRLDGPVRGNGKIIQELEGVFVGAGWETIKVLWGSSWDALFDADSEGWLQLRMEETIDGDLQTYKARDGAYGRETFFGKYPKLLEMVAHLSDAQVAALGRGGHDPVKLYAAYDKALKAKKPAVVLAQTIKGYGMGQAGESKNIAHQAKKLSPEDLQMFKERFKLPLSDAQLNRLEFYKPDPSAPEMRYLQQQRQKLGGYLPHRQSQSEALPIPERSALVESVAGSETREASTTMVFNQLLRVLLKEPVLGPRLVPMVPDEARTFGMNTLFSQIGIYSPQGQMYPPEDAHSLAFYKEDSSGQILQEGINEDGAISSWIAAATAYSTHNFPMLPMYIFYSMFGFQRVGDLIWAAADSRARGFLLGATAGRTTLSGEGLQHQDGHSHLVASTVPNCRAYDPAFAHELAVIVHRGMQEMLQEQQDRFYYITLMNQNYLHRPFPKGAEEGILKGMYLLRPSSVRRKRKVQLLGSGAILLEVLKAADMLEAEHGVAVNVWSVTSYTELHREGAEAEAQGRPAYVQDLLAGHSGPVIAASDYMRALPELIRAYIPGAFVTLGTDGFGRSDSRANLRAFFGVDAASIVKAALKGLET